MLNKSQPNKYVVAKDESLKKGKAHHLIGGFRGSSGGDDVNLICSSRKGNCISSLGLVSQILSLQKKVNFLKGRPFIFGLLPTFNHEISDLPRTSSRRGEDQAWPPISPHIRQVGQHFGITLAFVGLFTSKGQNLP